MYAVLQRIPAPYGRHGGAGWGPTVNGRLGWVLMEAPTLALFLPVLAAGSHAGEPVPMGLAALWLVHYAYRTLLYPARLPSVRPMPVVVVASGFGFQLVNASANAAMLTWHTDWTGWASDPRLAVGVGLFLVGQGAHHHGDAVLMGLRSRGETGYAIPHGGLYRWVTNVAYLGEIVTWTGWALACSTPAAVAFAVFTVANLVPRSRSNHAWYRATFADYPRDRAILLPGVW